MQGPDLCLVDVVAEVGAAGEVHDPMTSGSTMSIVGTPLRASSSATTDPRLPALAVGMNDTQQLAAALGFDELDIALSRCGREAPRCGWRSLRCRAPGQ